VKVSRATKAQCPQSYSAYSVCWDTYLLLLHEIHPTLDLNPYRLHSAYMRDHAFIYLTPLGAYAVDKTIRKYAALHNKPLHPISPHVQSHITALFHHHARTITFCIVCGEGNHEVAQCPDKEKLRRSDWQQPTSRHTKPPPPQKHSRQGGPPSSRVPCRQFSTRQGCTFSAKPAGCRFAHTCTVCKQSNRHTPNCARP